MTRFKINDFKKFKEKSKKITMLTAYDYPTALLAEEAGIDIILVGDSLGMVVLGYDDTTKVTMDDMIHHIKAVRRGAPNTYIIGDMPFLSYGYDIKTSVENAGRLIREGGCNAVKLEGGSQMTSTIKAIVDVGIPVIGHLGYTPQSTNIFGNSMVRGKNYETGKRLIEDAKMVEGAGAASLVLELVPHELSAYITELLSIPTIGIGSGSSCGGQVLVVNDILDTYKGISPKHNKVYVSLRGLIHNAIKEYIEDVQEIRFPKPENTFEMESGTMERLKEDDRDH